AVNSGEGDNVLTGASTFTVQGNLTLRAGNGANSVPNMAAAVNGNLNFFFGNGADTVTVSGPVGGTVLWRSGNGPDSLTLGLGAATANNYNVDVLFGSNDDTFTLNIGATNFITGRVDGDGRLTANTFNQI